jgi:taurine dioxygenase
LSDWVTRPEFLSRYRWQVGDRLMWDNRGAQHVAVKDDELPRHLRPRVTVNDAVPV